MVTEKFKEYIRLCKECREYFKTKQKYARICNYCLMKRKMDKIIDNRITNIGI